MKTLRTFFMSDWNAYAPPDYAGLEQKMQLVITQIMISAKNLRISLLPEGHFVWATLENPRPSVRCPSVRHRFLGISSINNWHANNIFGRYNQGIRDHLKSADCQLLSFIGYSAQHAACQKHTFFNEKSTTRKWTVFAKLTIFGSVL